MVYTYVSYLYAFKLTYIYIYIHTKFESGSWPQQLVSTHFFPKFAHSPRPCMALVANWGQSETHLYSGVKIGDANRQIVYIYIYVYIKVRKFIKIQMIIARHSCWMCLWTHWWMYIQYIFKTQLTPQPWKISRMAMSANVGAGALHHMLPKLFPRPCNGCLTHFFLDNQKAFDPTGTLCHLHWWKFSNACIITMIIR